MNETTLSTHVLDLGQGLPAAGMRVQLRSPASGNVVSTTVTNDDGRNDGWTPAVTLAAGEWELLFHAGEWYAAQGMQNFHPTISIHFVLEPGRRHLHVPLLLNRYGYSTYRGS